MTQEEQQQVNAAMRFLEMQVANVSREGASAAMLAERFAMENAALKARIAELEKPADNVVPIKEPA